MTWTRILQEKKRRGEEQTFRQMLHQLTGHRGPNFAFLPFSSSPVKFGSKKSDPSSRLHFPEHFASFQHMNAVVLAIALVVSWKIPGTAGVV